MVLSFLAPFKLYSHVQTGSPRAVASYLRLSFSSWWASTFLVMDLRSSCVVKQGLRMGNTKFVFVSPLSRAG